MVKNFLIVLKNVAMDAIKTASNRAIQKAAETTDDLIGNNIADRKTSFSKKSPTRLHSMELYSKNDDANNEIKAPSKRCISPEKRQQFIDELRLV